MGQPEEPDRLLGQHVGNYTIQRRIGAGGMGAVYLAENARIGRRVAIKVLEKTIAKDPTISARFESEARALTRIDHPNVVELFDFGVFDDTMYYVMEFLEGLDLARVLHRSGRLTALQAYPFVEQISSALQAVHDAGVIHRDLKPQNVLVLASDPLHLKIVDFGIARLMERERYANLTQTGLVIGTPTYIAPEQAAGEPDRVTERTDIYSLGVLIYEMLAGAPPFTDTAPGLLIARHIKDPPPPLADRVPGLPEALYELVECCLEKAPDDRPATAQSVAEHFRAAIEEFLDDGVPPSVPPTRIRAGSTIGGAGGRPDTGARIIPATVGSRPLDLAAITKNDAVTSSSKKRASASAQGRHTSTGPGSASLPGVSPDEEHPNPFAQTMAFSTGEQDASMAPPVGVENTADLAFEDARRRRASGRASARWIVLGSVVVTGLFIALVVTKRNAATNGRGTEISAARQTAPQVGATPDAAAATKVPGVKNAASDPHASAAPETGAQPGDADAAKGAHAPAPVDAGPASALDPAPAGGGKAAKNPHQGKGHGKPAHRARSSRGKPGNPSSGATPAPKDLGPDQTLAPLTPLAPVPERAAPPPREPAAPEPAAPATPPETSRGQPPPKPDPVPPAGE